MNELIYKKTKSMADLEISKILSEGILKKYDDIYINLLEEYYQSIRFLSENSLSLEFNNKDANHGVLVMSTLFQQAENEIRIFAGDFKGDICDNDYYIKSLFEAIERGVKLDIVFENNPNKSSKCYQELLKQKQNKQNKVNIFQLNEKYKKELVDKVGQLLHFTVIDKNKFRYETDKNEYKAYCNFDDKDNSEILISNYEKLINNSSSI